MLINLAIWQNLLLWNKTRVNIGVYWAFKVFAFRDNATVVVKRVPHIKAKSFYY